MPPVTLDKKPYTAEVLVNTGANYDEILKFTTIDGETYCGTNDTLDGQVIWVAHKPHVDDSNFRQIPVPVGDFITRDQRDDSFGFIVLTAAFVYNEYGYMHSEPEEEPEVVAPAEPVTPQPELDADGNPIVV
jgi:hypothetical protein